MRQQWLVFLPITLATAGLAACASVLGGEEVKVRPVDTLAAMGGPPRDTLYESAVGAINERDYGRALDYLQAAKTKDPRNVKALNALGVVYDKLGRFDLSARYYAQARAVEPDSRIVAENMGYSRVLQRLLNPNQPIAVATIDLPPGLIKSASSTAPSPAVEKTAVAAAVPAVPVPAAPVTERKVIDTMPHVATALPFALPDAKPVFASIVLPEPIVPAIEKRVIDAPPPSLAAAQFVLPDSRPIFASVLLSEPVVTEKKVIDTARPAMMVAPLALSQEKPFFATAILPEPVLPVTEKRVVDAAPRATAPFVLPDAKPLFAASLSPQLVAENVASAEPLPSAVTVPVPTKLMIASAPAVPVQARMVSAPTLMMMPSAKLVPATLLSSLPAAEPVTERKAAVAPAVAISTAPLPAKPVIVAPVIVASAAPAAVMPSMPEPKAATAAVPAVTPSVSSWRASAPKVTPGKKVVLPAVAIAPRLAKVTLPARPVMVASHPAAIASQPAKSRVQAPKQVASVAPMPAQMAPNTANRTAKILIGQPIRLFNASGKAGGTGTVLRRLTMLGWTMRPSEGRVQPATVLYYSAQNIAAAKALQRTLPFPVRLASDKGSGMRLVIGRDYLSWKPRNTRIAALWQKGTIVASLQKPSFRGVR